MSFSKVAVRSASDNPAGIMLLRIRKSFGGELMKLERWALIAEIVSGAAIVITLVILILEVRGNSAELQAATLSDIAGRTQEMALLQVRNPEYAAVRDRMDAGEELTTLERRMVNQALAAQLKLVEESYLAWKDGRLSDEVWESRANWGVNAFQIELRLEMWAGLRSTGGFVKSFSDWLDQAIA